MRLALRAMLRTPGFTITALLSLALAIGASAAAFAVIDAVRFRALPFPDGDRLVLLSEVPLDEGASAQAQSAATASSACRTACDVSYETFDRALRPRAFHALDLVAGYTSGGKALATKGEPRLVTGGVISPNLFELLHVQPLIGRAFSDEDNTLGATPVTILSHALWTSQFGGDPAVIGTVVKLSDTQYTVIGVMPPGFTHEVNSQFWLPVVPVLDPSTRPSIRTLTVIGRLAPGATVEQVRAELSAVEPVAPAPLGTSTARGAPPPRMQLTAAPLRERYAASTQSHDLIFGAVVACVLLIACANLSNLVFVRTLHQQRELAIRSALGGGVGAISGHLLRQYLLLVSAGGVLGVLLAGASLRVLQAASVLDSLRPPGMEYRLDARVVVFALAVAAATGALLSLLPARLVARLDAQCLLRDVATGSGGSRWGRRLQQGFVVAQVGSAVVLLTGGALMAKSVRYLSHVQLGFSANNLLQGSPSYPHPWRVPGTYLPVTDRILRELQAMPGVQGAAVRASIPLAPRGSVPAITLNGAAAPLPHGDAPTTAVAVTPAYFQTLDITVVRGRSFTDDDRAGGLPVAMVNEWAARRWWPGQDPLGQVVRVDTAPGLAIALSIVGVVHDNRAALPNVRLAAEGAELYRPWLQSNSAFPTFLVRSAAAPSALLRPVRELLVREVPDRPVFATLAAEQVADQLSGVRTNATQILAFAAVGLFLALLGIHGVLAYAVGVRAREIGIRGALGATRQRIAMMVLRDALAVTVTGVVLGLFAAVVAMRPLATLLHGTRTTDPLVYTAVALTVMIVALVASWIPARRASRVDPLDALRST
jgi:putative ABC transport system permease protein